ncbi:Two pore potassium channel protein sup-9 [Trichostrongylus colubriformis]|uniref:Two pore potassium channel protein sup-9 n=1 Tax=Trichostrongylus colubriformis TaxID=6319 RepID=A0AAN8INH0_TRICO
MKYRLQQITNAKTINDLAILDCRLRAIMDKKSSRALMLILTTFTYLLLGAAVFDVLESETESYVREEIAFVREKLQRKYNFTPRDFQLFESVAIKSIPHKATFQWQFSGAFYFATVVITTVGYGHSAPETMAGRFFCMIFALAGIPLGLIMFQSIGERVNTFIAFCLHQMRFYFQSHGMHCIREVTPTHLLIVSLSIGTSIIAIGTIVFHNEERWTLFDAYYYCFITLSTIGFGDLVPLQQGSALQLQPFYVIFTLLFVLLGLAVFSACVNLLVLGFMAPNADVVTAAIREPQSTIVFERFARSGSLVDSQLFGVRRPSRGEPGTLLGLARKQRSLSLLDIDARLKKEMRPKSITSICDLCRQHRRKRLDFSLKRPPTQNIDHLLYLNVDRNR